MRAAERPDSGGLISDSFFEPSVGGPKQTLRVTRHCRHGAADDDALTTTAQPQRAKPDNVAHEVDVIR